MCLWFASAYQGDFHVYLNGAHDLFSGALYSRSTRGELFTYPPFAALFFVPLAHMASSIAAQVIWALLNAAALVGLLDVSIKAVRPHLTRRSRRLWVLGLSAPALLFDPVLLALRDGQVDVLVTFLVVWDLIGGRRLGGKTAPQGVATGLAAAIKLTPLIFVPTSCSLSAPRKRGVVSQPSASPKPLHLPSRPAPHRRTGPTTCSTTRGWAAISAYRGCSPRPIRVSSERLPGSTTGRSPPDCS